MLQLLGGLYVYSVCMYTITCHWSRRVMRKTMMESANRSQAGSTLYDLSIYSHEQTHKVPTSSGGPGSHTQHRVFTQLSLALHQLLLAILITSHLLPPSQRLLALWIRPRQVLQKPPWGLWATCLGLQSFITLSASRYAQRV